MNTAFTIDTLAALSRASGASRNAGTRDERSRQRQLQRYIDALVKVYGVRPETRPGRAMVPYVPMPAAGVLLAWIREEAAPHIAPRVTSWELLSPVALGESTARWLFDPPVNATQPGLIRKWLGRVEQIVGKVSRQGVVLDPTLDSYEPLPLDVVGHALAAVGLKRTLTAPMALTAPSTYEFLDALARLAIHLDVLAGQPSRLALGTASVREAVAELPETITTVVTAPVRAAADAASATLRWVGWGLLGLGALWVVTR